MLSKDRLEVVYWDNRWIQTQAQHSAVDYKAVDSDSNSNQYSKLALVQRLTNPRTTIDRTNLDKARDNKTKDLVVRNRIALEADRYLHLEVDCRLVKALAVDRCNNSRRLKNKVSEQV